MKIDLDVTELGLLRQMMRERIIGVEGEIPPDHPSSVFRGQLFDKLEKAELDAIREQACPKPSPDLASHSTPSPERD